MESSKLYRFIIRCFFSEGTQEDLPVGLRMRASVATALGAAAAHAKILADQEEREMELLAASIIDQQVGLLVGSKIN